MLILCFIIHGTMNLLSNTCYISQYMGCHRIINMMTSSKIILKFWQLPRPLTTSWPHPWPLATSWPSATPPGHLLAVDLIILWPAYLVTLAENSDLERIKPNHVLEHLSMAHFKFSVRNVRANLCLLLPRTKSYWACAVYWPGLVGELTADNCVSQ